MTRQPDKEDDQIPVSAGAAPGQQGGVRLLVAAFILTFCLGSIHAFSVFIVPFEQAFAAGRAAVGFTYSLALVFLTISVLAGAQLYRRFSPAMLTVVACFGAAAGVLIAASGAGLGQLWLGFGVMFGAANGIGYGFAMVLAAKADPKRRGFWMGSVTAVYAVGAGVFGYLFDWLLASFSLQASLATLAVVLIVAGTVGGLLLRGQPSVVQPTAMTTTATRPGLTLQLWLAYGCSVAAGLMAIGHAAGIVRASGGDLAVAALGVSGIAVGNAAGGVTAGWLCDRVRANRLLACLTLISAVGIALLAVSPGTGSLILALGMTGFAYGAVIAVFPPVIVKMVGIDAYPRVYGRVFTAWGVAGLFAPWFAGAVFDIWGSYFLALLIAISLALIASLLNVRLRA